MATVEKEFRMRMSLWLRLAGLVLAVGVSATQAQSVYRSIPNGTPRLSGPVYTPAPPAPGCATPAPPVHSAMPQAAPAPYTPGSLPPSVNRPGAAAALPGAAAPAAPGAAPAAPGLAAPIPAATAAESRGESGGDALASAAPQMIGDCPATQWSTCYPGGPLVPLAVTSGIKIAENESPLPQDRVFAIYNYYNSVDGGGPQFGLHRALIGGEKTFLDGDASVGVRLPYLWSDNGGGSDLGYLSVIGKYAFYRCAETGDVVSGGLAVATTVGNDFTLLNGNTFSSVLLQPWAGFVCNVQENIYTHGFTSVIIPTTYTSGIETIYTADLGVGYRLFQSDSGGPVRAIIPTVEGHLTLPLGNSNRGDVLYTPTLVTITGGVHFGLGSMCWLTVGGNVPVSGPNLYDFEGMAQFNLRF
jgi:hypothetical protein